MSDNSTPVVPVLFFWSQHLMQWRPFFIAEGEAGRAAFADLRDQLGTFGFNVQPVELHTDGAPVTDADLDGLADDLPLPVSALLPPDPVGRLRISRSADASAVPVLYVWPECVAGWRPLVVAITPAGRFLARQFGEHLAGLGIHAWLVGFDRDDPDAIAATSRQLRPPPGAFVDPAPDGGLDHEWLAPLQPPH